MVSPGSPGLADIDDACSDAGTVPWTGSVPIAHRVRSYSEARPATVPYGSSVIVRDSFDTPRSSNASTATT